MRIDIISVQPDLLEGPFGHSILKRAIDRQLLEIHVHDLRKFGIGKHQQVDDYQYGGGAGMVMMCEPLAASIQSLQTQRDYDQIIFLTPDGETLRQARVNQLSLGQNLMMICGHYKGIDQRIRDRFITLEISIGDYVLSGGELAAAVLTDAIARLIPGALNDETSALTDSFQDDLLAPPIYTRPEIWEGMQVPEVLLSGDFKKIENWRMEQALRHTEQKRPDLLK